MVCLTVTVHPGCYRWCNSPWLILFLKDTDHIPSKLQFSSFTVTVNKSHKKSGEVRNDCRICQEAQNAWCINCQDNEKRKQHLIMMPTSPSGKKNKTQRPDENYALMPCVFSVPNNWENNSVRTLEQNYSSKTCWLTFSFASEGYIAWLPAFSDIWDLKDVKLNRKNTLLRASRITHRACSILQNL